jgi:hypothetical protein
MKPTCAAKNGSLKKSNPIKRATIHDCSKDHRRCGIVSKRTTKPSCGRNITTREVRRKKHFQPNSNFEYCAPERQREREREGETEREIERERERETERERQRERETERETEVNKERKKCSDLGVDGVEINSDGEGFVDDKLTIGIFESDVDYWWRRHEATRRATALPA